MYYQCTTKVDDAMGIIIVNTYLTYDPEEVTCEQNIWNPTLRRQAQTRQRKVTTACITSEANFTMKFCKNLKLNVLSILSENNALFITYFSV